MEKMLKKKGAIDVSKIIIGIVLTIVAIIVIFNIVGGSSTSLTTAANNISGSGLPLASLFSSSGVVMLIFMAGILIAVIMMALKHMHGDK